LKEDQVTLVYTWKPETDFLPIRQEFIRKASVIQNCKIFKTKRKVATPNPVVSINDAKGSNIGNWQTL